ncbi:hypothetical protein [Micromonospora sp. NPDC049891]|uniref:hypothetical protein n=1 Tax=Micromonospora sp. NPDC049891 TaxID=3155655 RepID=UPI0033DBEBF1
MTDTTLAARASRTRELLDSALNECRQNGNITGAVADVAAAIECAQDLLHMLVEEARAKGHTWDEISTYTYTSAGYIRSAVEGFDVVRAGSHEARSWHPLNCPAHKDDPHTESTR